MPDTNVFDQTLASDFAKVYVALLIHTKEFHAGAQ